MYFSTNRENISSFRELWDTLKTLTSKGRRAEIFYFALKNSAVLKKLLPLLHNICYEDKAY